MPVAPTPVWWPAVSPDIASCRLSRTAGIRFENQVCVLGLRHSAIDSILLFAGRKEQIQGQAHSRCSLRRTLPTTERALAHLLKKPDPPPRLPGQP